MIEERETHRRVERRVKDPRILEVHAQTMRLSRPTILSLFHPSPDAFKGLKMYGSPFQGFVKQIHKSEMEDTERNDGGSRVQPERHKWSQRNNRRARRGLCDGSEATILSAAVCSICSSILICVWLTQR